MSSKNSATNTGHGAVDKMSSSLCSSNDMAEKKCVECTKKTSTPHAKLSNGDYLCSSKCSTAYYAKENDLGAWGIPTTFGPKLRSVT